MSLTDPEIINLTPHAVHLCDLDGTPIATIPASGQVARCATLNEPVGYFGLGSPALPIPLYTVRYGEVQGLPEPQENTLYIVSYIVRAALPGRLDLASPGELTRDASGMITGCKGLAVNG